MLFNLALRVQNTLQDDFFGSPTYFGLEFGVYTAILLLFVRGLLLWVYIDFCSCFGGPGGPFASEGFFTLCFLSSFLHSPVRYIFSSLVRTSHDDYTQIHKII